MALLDANEYVNNYVIPKLFENPASITAEQKQAMIKTWSIILDHIEDYICITVLPFVITNIPELPVASAATGIDVAFGSGIGLTQTGGILALRIVNEVLGPAGVKAIEWPAIIEKLTKNFNLLFEHICKNAVVTVSQIPHSGTVVAGTYSFGYGNVSQAPITGIEMSLLTIVDANTSGGTVSFTPPEADVEYKIELLLIISSNLKENNKTLIVTQNDTEILKEELILRKGSLPDTAIRVTPSSTDPVTISIAGTTIGSSIVTYIKTLGGGTDVIKLR